MNHTWYAIRRSRNKWANSANPFASFSAWSKDRSPSTLNWSAKCRQSDCILLQLSSLPDVQGVLNADSLLSELHIVTECVATKKVSTYINSLYKTFIFSWIPLLRTSKVSPAVTIAVMIFNIKVSCSLTRSYFILVCSVTSSYGSKKKEKKKKELALAFSANGLKDNSSLVFLYFSLILAPTSYSAQIVSDGLVLGSDSFTCPLAVKKYLTTSSLERTGCRHISVK